MRRKPRRWCPRITPRTAPSYIGKRNSLMGRSDYINGDGEHCSHWQSRETWACWCHIDPYEERWRNLQTSPGG